VIKKFLRLPGVASTFFFSSPKDQRNTSRLTLPPLLFTQIKKENRVNLFLPPPVQKAAARFNNETTEFFVLPFPFLPPLEYD